jgi:cytochrome bd ubiquinol oxidase subunit I
VVATFFSLLQLLAGSRSAEGVAKNQPAKLAAMEGHYDTSSKADMFILGFVNNKEQKTTGIKIPGGLSYLVHGDFNKPIKGLNAFKEDERPKQVNAIFQVYHLMIAIGFSLIALTVYGCIQWKRKKLFQQKWLLGVFAWSVLLPQFANEAGWFTAEMGRQPWVVYGLLKTSDALSKTVSANQIVFSLVLFMAVYSLLFVLFLYLLNKKIKDGPGEYGKNEDIEEGTRRNNPVLKQNN